MRSKAQDDAAREALGSERWRRHDLSRQALLDGLLAGRMAGPVVSHDRANVRWKIAQFASGDPRSQFGISGLGALSEEDVMALMGEAAGFEPEVVSGGGDGPVPVDPEHVLVRLEEAGDRLAEAAARGETVLLATGHPVGLVLLYAAVGELLVARGGGSSARSRVSAGGAWGAHGRSAICTGSRS